MSVVTAAAGWSLAFVEAYISCHASNGVGELELSAASAICRNLSTVPGGFGNEVGGR